jgi:hypothetical protein
MSLRWRLRICYLILERERDKCICKNERGSGNTGKIPTGTKNDGVKL